jgi:hypothetical protein
MILTRSDSVARLEERLSSAFYAPRGLPTGVIRCTPSAGSGVVAID